jgi:hypothetical protein
MTSGRTSIPSLLLQLRLEVKSMVIPHRLLRQLLLELQLLTAQRTNLKLHPNKQKSIFWWALLRLLTILKWKLTSKK